MYGLGKDIYLISLMVFLVSDMILLVLFFYGSKFNQSSSICVFFIYFMSAKNIKWMFITLTSIILSFSSTGIIILSIIIFINYLDKISIKLTIFFVMTILFMTLIYIVFIQSNLGLMKINWITFRKE